MKLSRSALACALLTMLTIVLNGPLAPEARSDTSAIKIASFDWTSSALTTAILAKIFVSRGYDVQIVASSSLAGSLDAISNGDLTIGLEYRMTGSTEHPSMLFNPLTIEDLGPLGPEASQTWWYPAYVKELCPELPALQGLVHCAQLFSSPQSNGRGLMISGPVGWGYDDDARVAALGLPFEVVHVASDTSIEERIETAFASKKPILIALSSPTWISFKYKGEGVKTPNWTQECDEDPTWGTNPTRVKDCAGPSSDIRKLAWTGMKTRWPEAWAIAKGLSFNDRELDDMLYEIGYKGKPLDAVAQAWIDQHAAQIDAWAISND